MLNPAIAYIGGDKAFEQALGLSAGSLGITLNVVTSSKNTPNLAAENLIFIIDGDSIISEEAIRNSLNMSRQSNLVVLAISNLQKNKLSVPAWLWKQCVDVFIKPVPQELLDNRISFYIELLQTVANSPDSDNTASLLKENHSLARQVALLKQHLGQIDMDLHVRSEVINKISRISHLSRQINCLDLDKIASVCIEEIPQLISAKFASLYRFDPEKKVLHLLRHNHPYMIDRMVVLDKHETSPMVMAIKNKKLLLIKDLSHGVLGEDMTVNRLYARNYHSNS